MKRTLLVLSTHFVDETVISEFRKMKNAPNVDAILAINNEECRFEFKNRVENRIFFGTSCKCFFFDANLHDNLELPYFTYDGPENFRANMMGNCDYKFYYLRKILPDYDYY
jgi:hypothetical protein